MSKFVTKKRYAKEGNTVRTETHRFKTTRNGGFALPYEEFPEADPNSNYRIIVATNMLYDNYDKNEYPYDKPLRAGVVLIDENQLQVEVETAKQSVQEAAPDPEDSKLDGIGAVALKDDAKIFFIDYYGQSYKTNPQRREWFNRMFGFDPVDEDPRN